MAEIKLYGNAVNGDGKYIISPFDIAAPKADGKTAYTEDDKADDKNIVSYINSKVASLTSGIGAVKTGIAEVTFYPSTVNLTPGMTVKTDLTILAKDSSKAADELSITMPSADTIVTGASSYTNLVNEFKKLQTSYSTLNTTVGTINGASSGYRKGDTDTLKAAKKYADDKVNNLGDVYHIEGTKSLTEAKALSNVKKGSVYNISEAFTIDGKQYPEYTNLLFIADTPTVTWDSNKGFVGTQVDALGGVQDLSAYSLKANTVSTIIFNDNNNALSDTGAATTITTIDIYHGAGSVQTLIPVTAKLPTTLVKVNEAKLTAYLNELKISGMNNLSGTTVTPLTYANTVISVTTVTPSSTETQKFTFSVTGELGTTGIAGPIPLSKASDSRYGVVKIGRGINVSNGVITARENTFSTTPYMSMTSSPNATDGTKFIFDINCNTETPGTSIIPLQKCDASTLGIKYNLNKSTYVKVWANGLDMAFDDSELSTKIAGIESRITALETLLSLA